MTQSTKKQPYHGVLCLASNTTKLISDKLIELINRLYLHRTVNGDNIEKLKNFDNIWSSRNNLEQRLIYCSIKLEGKRYLLLIDFLENHEYQKLERNKKILKHLRLKIRTQTISVEHHPAYAPQQLAEIKPQFHFSEDKNYHLTEEQFGTLRKKLPLLINGSAGSGKSSTAFSKMARVVLNRDENNPLRMLYITANQALIDEQKELWQQSRFALIAAEKSFVIEFLSYDELTLNNTPSPESNEILLWYQSAIKKLVTIEKINPQQKKQWHDNFTKVIEEFNRLCIYSQDDYCQKFYGEKNTYFADTEQRAIIYQLYLDYQKKFNDIRYQIKHWQNNYGLIICDEAQDFSAQQLVNLFNLAQNGRIIYCVDNNQSLQYAISIRHQLTDFIQKTGRQLECTSLYKSFRNPPHVVNLANSVLKILQTSNKGITDKLTCHEMTPANEQQSGFALLVETPEQCLIKAQQSGIHNFQIAVVANSNEQVEKAKIQFPRYAVFTPDKIKGLEFDLIIAYQPLDDDAFYQANEQLDGVEQLSVKKNRSKQLPQQQLTTAFHALYTTITRARKGVIFYHQGIHLPHLLQHLVFSNENTMQVSQTIDQPQDNEKGQIDLIKKLIKQNNYIDAMDIWTRVMNNSAHEFEQRFNLQPVAASSSSSSSSSSRKYPVITMPQQSQVDEFIFDIDKVDENYLSTLASQKKSSRLFFKPQQQFNGLSFYQTLKQHPIHSQTLQSLLKQKEFNRKIYPEEIKKLINTFNQSMLAKSKRRGASKKRATTSREIWNSLFDLAKKFQIEINDIYLLDGGFTPLMMMSLFGNADLAIQMLNQGCDANSVDCWGNTALIYAASTFDITFDTNQNVLLVLTVAATRIKQLYENQETDSLVKFFQLMSTKQGKLTIVETLLSKNYSINQQNDEGNTALHEASITNFASMVKLLTEKGADVNIVNNQNRTPFFIATYLENFESMEYLAKHDYNIENNRDELIKALILLISRKNIYEVAFIFTMLHHENHKELEKLLFLSINLNSSKNNQKVKFANLFSYILAVGSEELVFILLKLINHSQLYGDLLFRLLTTSSDDENNNSLMLIVKTNPKLITKFHKHLFSLSNDLLIKLFSQSNIHGQTLLTLSLEFDKSLFDLLIDYTFYRGIFFNVLVNDEFPHLLARFLKQGVGNIKGLAPLLERIKKLDMVQQFTLYQLKDENEETILDYCISHSDEVKQLLLLRAATENKQPTVIRLLLKSTKKNFLHHAIINKKSMLFDELKSIIFKLNDKEIVDILSQPDDMTGNNALLLCMQHWGAKVTCDLIKQCNNTLSTENYIDLILKSNYSTGHSLLSLTLSLYSSQDIIQSGILSMLLKTFNYMTKTNLDVLFSSPHFDDNIFVKASTNTSDDHDQIIIKIFTALGIDSSCQINIELMNPHDPEVWGISLKNGTKSIYLVAMDEFNSKESEFNKQYDLLEEIRSKLEHLKDQCLIQRKANNEPYRFFSNEIIGSQQAASSSYSNNI